MTDTIPNNPSTAFRRSFTLPTQLPRPSDNNNNNNNRTPKGANGGTSTLQQSAETLFAHHSAKIVQFPATPLGSAQKTETLPWSKLNEQTVAFGALKLYRLQGHVGAFLHSGNFLLSLMPRSQCWCVDGVSKFAFQLRMEIYRVELPYETDQDRACVEDFKIAIGKVLLYERTPCPFKRGFETQIQEQHVAPLPVKKLVRSDTKARKWAYDEGWRPEGVKKPVFEKPILRKTGKFNFDRRRASSSSRAEEDDGGSLSGRGSDETLSTKPTSISAAETEPFVNTQVKRLETKRSVSMPLDYLGKSAMPPEGSESGIGEESVILDASDTQISSFVLAGSESPTAAPARALHRTAEWVPQDAPPTPESAGGVQKGSGNDSAPSSPERPVDQNSNTHLSRSPSPLSAAQAAPASEEEQTGSGSVSTSRDQATPEAPGQPKEVACEGSLLAFGPCRATVTEERSIVEEQETNAPEDYGLRKSSSVASSIQSFQTARSTVLRTPERSPAIDSPTSFVQLTIHEEPECQASTKLASLADARPTPEIASHHQDTHNAAEGVEATVPMVTRRSTTPPATPRKAPLLETPRAGSQTQSGATTAQHPTPPSSPPSTVRARPSQTLRQFRQQRRPSTPTKHSTATARGLDLSMPSYLRDDRLPVVPYGNSNQGVISSALSLLMGPPSGLVQVMMQIAARVASSASSASTSGGAAAGMGEAYFRRHSRDISRWVPGGWDSESECSGDGEEDVFVEADEEAVEEDDYGVPLGSGTPARRKREAWGLETPTRRGVLGEEATVD